VAAVSQRIRRVEARMLYLAKSRLRNVAETYTSTDSLLFGTPATFPVSSFLMAERPLARNILAEL
jgi:hypothetical protein